MTLAAHLFPEFNQKALTKAVNLSSDSLKVTLFSAYTFANSHATMTDVYGAGTETSGTGFTAGGQALTSVSLSTTGLVTTLTAANPSWSSATFSAAFAIFFDAQGGTNATNFPIAYWDFGTTISTTATTYLLAEASNGICTWTTA